MTFYKNFGISFDGFNFENLIVSNQTTKIFTIWQDYEFDVTYYLFFILNLYNLIISTIIAAGAKNKYALAKTSSSLIERAIIIPPKIL